MRNIHPVNWIQWLTLLLAMTIAITTPVLFFRIQDVQHHQNDALDSILCYAERVVRASHDIAPKQRAQALHFYEQSIQDAHLKPCD